MISSLRFTFRTLLRLPSRRFLSKEAAFDKTDVGYQEASYEVGAYPELMGGRLRSKVVVGRITKWLECSPKQAEHILIKAPSLTRCHLDSVEAYVNFMKDMRIERELIIGNPWLLDYSLSTMRQRISWLSQVGICQNTIHLLRLDAMNLEKVVQKWISDERTGKFDQNGNRLEFFSKKLQCSVEQLAILMKKDCSLLTYSFSRVSRMLFLLLDYGIAPSDILNNVGVFRRPLGKVKNRLEAARSANATVKIWMLTLTPDRYDEILENRRNTIDELQTEDVINILAKRLECERDYVLTVTNCYQKLLRVFPIKLNQMFDLLYESGFTSRDICLRPLVLTLHLEMVQGRLQRFKECGLKPIIYPMFFDSKHFNSYIAELNAKVCESDNDV